MDYGRILTRAWQITWRWKILWVLGFLAALGNGGGGGGGNARFSGDQFPGLNMPSQATGLLVAIGCIVFILIIVVWVLSTMARGGLIAGVTQVEDQGATTLGQAWAVGQRYFWRLFGISVLAALPILILVILGVIVFAAGAGGAAVLSGDNIDRTILPALGGLLLCLVPLLCIGVLLAIVLDQIRTYAERAAVLEDRPWIEAFKRGWQVLRQNLGPTVILWLIFLVVGLVFGAIIVGGLLAIFLPIFVVSGTGGGSDAPNWLWLPLCGLGLVVVVIGALVGSVVQTFTSATWTLAYRELTGRSAVIAVPPPAESPIVE